MSYDLNSLRGGYIGNYIGDYNRGYKRDTRSLDSCTYNLIRVAWILTMVARV